MDFETQLSKRSLLRHSTTLPLVWAIASGASAQILGKQDSRLVIADLLDVIIPQDTTPSATQLKVDEKVWEYAQQVPNYENMLFQGAAWLNQQAHRMSMPAGFVRLSLVQKNQLITTALLQPRMTLPRVFMGRLMADTYRIYYGQPEAYRGVRGMHPIQPLGYPNHHRAP